MEKKNKNWWLKLPENFYDQEEIKMIEALPDGAVYLNFYFKILLKSLSNDGNLMFKNVIPYTPEMLSSVTNTPIATVKYAVELFEKLGLIEKIDGDTLHMTELKKMTGCETKFAEKKREYRESLKNKDSICIEDKSKTKKDNVRQETRVKRLELREKTTTSSSENFEKESTLYIVQDFLNYEKYNKINISTKANIMKNFPKLTEERFELIYKLAVKEFEEGRAKDFNAVLYQGIQDKWEFKADEVRRNKKGLTTIKEVKKEEQVNRQPEAENFLNKILIKLETDENINFAWKSNLVQILLKITTIEEMKEILKKYRYELE